MPKSRYRGLTWRRMKAGGLWQVRLYSEGTSYEIGWFADENTAAQAYNTFAEALLGADARLNTIVSKKLESQSTRDRRPGLPDLTMQPITPETQEN